MEEKVASSRIEPLLLTITLRIDSRRLTTSAIAKDVVDLGHQRPCSRRVRATSSTAGCSSGTATSGRPGSRRRRTEISPSSDSWNHIWAGTGLVVRLVELVGLAGLSRTLDDLLGNGILGHLAPHDVSRPPSLMNPCRFQLSDLFLPSSTLLLIATAVRRIIHGQQRPSRAVHQRLEGLVSSGQADGGRNVVPTTSLIWPISMSACAVAAGGLKVDRSDAKAAAE